MATKVIPLEHQVLLNQLQTCTLNGILLDPYGQWLSFDFISTIDEPGIVIKLFNLTIFKLSRTLDDEGPFVIGEASLSSLEDGGKGTFTSLGYDFRDEDGTMASYLSRSLLYFHLEGDICINAICEAYEILQEIKYQLLNEIVSKDVEMR